MLKYLYQSLMATLVLVVICCGIYPLVVTGVGQLFFKHQAIGSPVTGANQRILGSKLIGQSFTKPEYLHGRPSAAGNGYDAANSSGSNLGPTNQKMADTLKANVELFLKENPTAKAGTIPPDAVTASGSGLDPQITPENASAQVDRIAKARKISTDRIRALLNEHLEGPQMGLFGEPTVNVLLVNMDLDRKFPISP